MSETQKMLLRALLFGIAVAFLPLINYAAGEVDATFNVGVQIGSSENYVSAVQPDGKILVGGRFKVADGQAHDSILRLNADGSLDTTFSGNLGDAPETVRSVNDIGLQSDGKIIIAGRVGTAAFILRLNQNGTVDNSFAAIFSNQNVNEINDIVVYSDNRILIGGVFDLVNNSGRKILARLQPNGALDASFTPIDFVVTNRAVGALALQPDGKIVLAGQYILYRVNSDGSFDSSFASGSPGDLVTSLVRLPDGKFLVGGQFNTLNGFTVNGIGRVNADGSLDNSFNTSNTGGVSINDIEIDANGKILIGGTFTAFNGASRRKAARLESSGAVDMTFDPAFAPSDNVSDLTLLAGGRIVAVGQFPSAPPRRNKAVFLDASGNQTVFSSAFNSLNGTVFDVAAQPDGKVLIGGSFTEVNVGNSRASLARLNPNGSTDADFVTPLDTASSVNAVYAIAPQSNGQIVIGGQFLTGAPSFRSNLIRVNSNGSFDSSFNPALNAGQIVRAVVNQPDGKIIVAGRGSSTDLIRRLNADGTTDASFSIPTFGFPTGTGSEGFVLAVAVQPDGKILVVGSFTSVNGGLRGRIARLNSDGTLDLSFSPPFGANSNILDLALQPDGKIVVGGGFTAINNNSTQPYLARLNADGSLDTGFAPQVNNNVQSVEVAANGKILVGGQFNAVNARPRGRVARLNADGSLDESFRTSVGANGTVFDILPTADGKIYLGGAFTRVDNVSRVGVARLNQVSRQGNFDFDGDGRADVATWRASNGLWSLLNSQNSSFTGVQWGQNGDALAPADYNGDGRTDFAVFRAGANPDLATFFILENGSNTVSQIQFGSSGDVPVSGDWDKDGRADLAVYRAGAQSKFFYRPSGSPGVGFRIFDWGTNGDKPIVGDFDGDGAQDAAVWRPSNGVWYVLQSSNSQNFIVQWGQTGDVPAAADYDGDGRTDVTVWRPSNSIWYRINSSNNQFTGAQFGIAEDLITPADYDGDGRADLAVWRPSSQVWFLQQTTNGFTALQFGASGDKPVPNTYIR